MTRFQIKTLSIFQLYVLIYDTCSISYYNNIQYYIAILLMGNMLFAPLLKKKNKFKVVTASNTCALIQPTSVILLVCFCSVNVKHQWIPFIRFSCELTDGVLSKLQRFPQRQITNPIHWMFTEEKIEWGRRSQHNVWSREMTSHTLKWHQMVL